MDIISRIKQRRGALMSNTPVLTRVAKCIDVKGEIFENVLY
jgi:hypothetical protein